MFVLPLYVFVPQVVDNVHNASNRVKNRVHIFHFFISLFLYFNRQNDQLISL